MCGQDEFKVFRAESQMSYRQGKSITTLPELDLWALAPGREDSMNDKDRSLESPSERKGAESSSTISERMSIIGSFG